MKTQILKSTPVLLVSSFLFFAFVSCQKEQPVSTTSVQGHNGVSAAKESNGSAETDFKYLLGVAPIPGPDKAEAENEDVITLTGSGTLSVHPKSVTGGGSFTHTNAAGKVLAKGTWTALDLLSFKSYGTSFPAFPANFTGGEALIRIHLLPAGDGPGPDAILTIECLIGDPPAGKTEGIRVAVEDGPNFNEQAGGATLFILI